MLSLSPASYLVPVGRTFSMQTLGVFPSRVTPGQHVRLQLLGFGGYSLLVRIIRTVGLGPVVSYQQLVAPQDTCDIAITTVDELAAGFYQVRIYCQETRTNHQISLEVAAS